MKGTKNSAKRKKKDSFIWKTWGLNLLQTKMSKLSKDEGAAGKKKVGEGQVIRQQRKSNSAAESANNLDCAETLLVDKCSTQGAEKKKKRS